MKHGTISALIAALLGCIVAQPILADDGSEAVERYDFDVYLNDKRVGKHTYEVVEEGGVQRVSSEANFKYRILFIPAYRYEHSNSERWADNCLVRFEANTNANGERHQRIGRAERLRIHGRQRQKRGGTARVRDDVSRTGIRIF